MNHPLNSAREGGGGRTQSRDGLCSSPLSCSSAPINAGKSCSVIESRVAAAQATRVSKDGRGRMDVTHICFAGAAELIRLARLGKTRTERERCKAKEESFPSTSLSSFQCMQGISDGTCMTVPYMKKAVCANRQDKRPVRFNDNGQVILKNHTAIYLFIFFQ